MHALHSFYRRIRLMSKQTKGMAKPPIETKKENLMADGRVQEFLYYNVICIRLLAVSLHPVTFAMCPLH